MNERLLQIAAVHVTRKTTEVLEDGTNRLECGCVASHDRRYIVTPCPALARDRERLTHPSDQQQRTSSALSELAAMGSDICALLSAVQSGATLVITGPDPLGNSRAPRFGATIQSATGARDAHATGHDLPRLLSDLARDWGTK